MDLMKSVSIIGIGRVGGALASALGHAGWRVRELVVRELVPSVRCREALNFGGEFYRFDDRPEITADLVLIAVQDDLISNVSGALALWKGRFSAVMHVSGAETSEAISVLRERGTSVGSFHPLISVADSVAGADSLRGANFCFEGDDLAGRFAKLMADDLGGQLFSIDTGAKASYHASAVMACGHLVALIDAASEVLGATGVPEDSRISLLLPLIESTIANLRRGTPDAALTGPFRRGDETTVDRHLKALGELSSAELLQIYSVLGVRSLQIAEQAGLKPEKSDRIRRKISLAK